MALLARSKLDGGHQRWSRRLSLVTRPGGGLGTFFFRVVPYSEGMLILEGKYVVQPNKKLAIYAEGKTLPAGTLESDIEALQKNCQGKGRCDVQVNTQHGIMRGTLIEKKPYKFSGWHFEGHLAFPPKA